MPRCARLRRALRLTMSAAAFIALCLCGCRSSDRDAPYEVVIDLEPEIAAVGSDDLFVSEPAREKLVALGASALPAFTAALAYQSPAVRVAIVETLGQIEAPEASALLIDAISNDSAPEVRHAALRSLPTSDTPAARQAVEASLVDPEPSVRLAAARACAWHCTTPAALARLVQNALEDAPKPNFLAARLALVTLLRQPTSQQLARRTVVARARPAIADVADPIKQARAALLASDAGDASGREVLMREAARTDDPMARLQAIHALGIVGDTAAVQALAAQATDPTVALYTFDALRRLDGRGVEGAAAALRDYDGPVAPAELPPPYRLGG